MYDTLEEIDAALKKLDKRYEDAKEMVDNGSWGGLLRGSTKKAGIKEQRQELLRKREMLLKNGAKIDYGSYLSDALSSLISLMELLDEEETEKRKKINDIVRSIDNLREEYFD